MTFIQAERRTQKKGARGGERALQRGKNCSDNDTTEIKNDI